jgi:copper(I)-binding protein
LTLQLIIDFQPHIDRHRELSRFLIMFFARLLIPSCIAMSSLLSASAAFAGEDMIMIAKPFARATAGRAKNGAAFLTVMNHGKRDDALIAVETAAANRPELHSHIHDKGIMRMRQVEAINIPAGGSAELKPGGDHVMLMGLTGPLMTGEKLSLILVFKNAGKIAVEVPIGTVGAAAPADAGHAGHVMTPAKKD